MPEKLWVGGVAQSVIRVAQSVIWWVVSYILVSLQSSLELEFGVLSLDFEFGVGLDFDWTSA